MSRGIFETFLGAVVLVVAIGFAGKLFLANDTAAISTYDLSMRFGNAQGLREASEVRLGGVFIGEVTQIRLDDETLEAVVSVEIDSSVRLPTDTSAAIASAGLLGNSFLNILPGEARTHLEKGGEIPTTKDPQSLEDLLGQAIFALTEK